MYCFVLVFLMCICKAHGKHDSCHGCHPINQCCQNFFSTENNLNKPHLRSLLVWLSICLWLIEMNIQSSVQSKVEVKFKKKIKSLQYVICRPTSWNMALWLTLCSWNIKQKNPLVWGRGLWYCHLLIVTAQLFSGFGQVPLKNSDCRHSDVTDTWQQVEVNQKQVRFSA